MRDFLLKTHKTKSIFVKDHKTNSPLYELPWFPKKIRFIDPKLKNRRIMVLYQLIWTYYASIHWIHIQIIQFRNLTGYWLIVFVFISLLNSFHRKMVKNEHIWTQWNDLVVNEVGENYMVLNLSPGRGKKH